MAANKYCNLPGSEKVKDSYTLINDGFEDVQKDVEELEKLGPRVDNLVNNPDPNKDLELVDARLGADGVARETAGQMVREIHSEVLEPNYSEEVEVVDGIASLPENAIKGQVNDIKLFGNFDGTKSTISASRLKSVGKNLFNPNAPNIPNKYVNGPNLANSSTGLNVFTIKVKPSLTFTRSGNSASGWRILDVDNNVVSHGPSNSITIPPNGYILQVSAKQEDYNTFQLEVGTVATPYEPYTESTQYFTAKDSNGNIVELRSLPNGTKDEISDKLYKRTDKRVLQASDIIQVVTSTSNLDYALIKKPSDYIYATTNNISLGSKIIEGYEEKYTLTPDDASYIGKTVVPFATGQFAVGFSKGTTLAQAQTELTGKSLIYQLMEPIITPIEVDGVLASYPKGTVYVEPYIKEEFVITGNTITLPKPVSAIVKIEKLENNIWQETSGTLSLNGLLITELTPGSYRVFAPIRSDESTLPEVTMKVPINLKAQVESNAKAITTIGKGMLDLGDEVDANAKKVMSHMADYESLLAGGEVFTATLQNGWTGALKYQKNGLGQVWLSGSITSGTVADGTIIAVFPTAYRPDAFHIEIPAYRVDGDRKADGLYLSGSESGLFVHSTNIPVGALTRFGVVYQAKI